MPISTVLFSSSILAAPLQHDHPLAGWLVVPEAIWGSMAVGDDSFDADAKGLQEGREEVGGEVGKDVDRIHVTAEVT